MSLSRTHLLMLLLPPHSAVYLTNQPLHKLSHVAVAAPLFLKQYERRQLSHVLLELYVFVALEVSQYHIDVNDVIASLSLVAKLHLIAEGRLISPIKGLAY